MDFHYCQGEIENFAILSEAESCHVNDNVCPMHTKACENDNSQCENSSQDEDNCCHNEKKLIKLPVKYTFDKPAVYKILDFVYDVSVFVYKVDSFNICPSYKYFYVGRPPPVDSDYQSLFQSYLL